MTVIDIKKEPISADKRPLITIDKKPPITVDKIIEFLMQNKEINNRQAREITGLSTVDRIAK